ncbi:hypothetical protein Gohar_021377, partial [Gossypium harknessii]|nr:hypothetical protein [Gossypium harknessii]
VEKFEDFYSLPSSSFTHSVPNQPYFTLANSHLKNTQRQPFLASSDSDIPPLHPSSSEHFFGYRHLHLHLPS